MGGITVYPPPYYSTVRVPAARVRLTTEQNIASGAWVPINFQAVDEDTDGMFNSATPSRLTVRTPGLWIIQGGICYRLNTSGSRGTGLRKNGTGSGGPTFGHTIQGANPTWAHGMAPTSPIVRLVAGDYIELLGLQNAASTLGVYAEDGNPHLAMARIGA